MRYPLAIVLLLSLARPVAAEDGPAAEGIVDREFAFDDAYRFGVVHHRLDGYSRVTGWKISQQWYFGQHRGEEASLGFVWQRDDDQMSISTNGLRFTRRF